MNLIFIYGAPATGKLTVAAKLEELTGYALFHNHISRDLVEDIYGDDLRTHYDLVDAIRRKVFSYCAMNDTNLIFTFVYDGSNDDPIVNNYVEDIETNGGHVLFVELTASHEDIVKRVQDDSRKQHGKLTDANVMKNLLSEINFGSVSYEKVLKIDTSENSPENSAKIIAEHYNLV